MTDKLIETGFTEKLTQGLMSLLASIPSTKELASSTPAQRAQELTKAAAAKTAAISGGAALVPGPLGLATLLPDLITVYRIQAQLVADVAAVYGKSATLDETQMLYCLFKHGGAHLFRDVVTRAGERFLVRRASLRTIQQIVNKIGYRVTQKLIGRTVARWIPFIGAAGVGIYAYKDTKKVGTAAMELFGNDAAFTEEDPQSPAPRGDTARPQP
ncbi:EcsC family protein [Ramlibacter sp. XY19]|uniref:EcsC family protein n=1 Tax=Ramlibacter paludis TaxID=2908000 RepID=UPI0023DB843D|nr:EcsC family protein [Ramlibacter paludis]